MNYINSKKIFLALALISMTSYSFAADKDLAKTAAITAKTAEEKKSKAENEIKKDVVEEKVSPKVEQPKAEEKVSPKVEETKTPEQKTFIAKIIAAPAVALAYLGLDTLHAKYPKTVGFVYGAITALFLNHLYNKAKSHQEEIEENN